jgi:hypothetical protein
MQKMPSIDKINFMDTHKLTVDNRLIRWVLYDPTASRTQLTDDVTLWPFLWREIYNQEN